MKMQRSLSCAALVLAGLLAGCGGGGDEADTAATEDATDTVPSSATASIQAFVGFVRGQAAADHAEPLSLQGTMPPTSETAEPMDLG